VKEKPLGSLHKRGILRPIAELQVRAGSMRRVFVLLVVVVVILVACGASEASNNGDVKKVAVALVWENIHAQYGKVWATLHPRYQRVTTRAFWESCQRRKAEQQAGVDWLSIRASDAYSDRVSLPLLGTIPVTAVTIEAKVSYLGAKHTISDTNYWVKLGSSWRGLWNPETYRAYKAHRCPA
jgi:hypothetical protein